MRTIVPGTYGGRLLQIVETGCSDRLLLDDRELSEGGRLLLNDRVLSEGGRLLLDLSLSQVLSVH